MIAGDTTPCTSPCGVNCTYSLDFDGPALECTGYATNQSTGTDSFQYIYTDIWSGIEGASVYALE